MTVTEIEPTKRWSATGVIKKVFPHKRQPYGFLRVLTPVDWRGQEAVFFYTDIVLSADELEFVQPGLTMQFSMIEKPEDRMVSRVPFKAEQIKPMDPVEQQGLVVRGPRDTGKGIIVSLDHTSMNVHISANSWSELCASQTKHEPLLPGDTVIVRLYWKEVLQASKEKRSPVGEIIKRLHSLPRTSRRRSLSSKSRCALQNTGELEGTTEAVAPVETKAPEREQDEGNRSAKRDVERPQDADVKEDERSVKPAVEQIDCAASLTTLDKKLGRPIISDTVDFDDNHPCALHERESRKRRADRLENAPTERRRTRSCGNGLAHQAFVNHAFFTEELARPLPVPDGEASDPSLRRMSSPVHIEPTCFPQYHQYPAGPFLPCEGGCTAPILAQAAMWSQWSQTAYRGPSARMSLKEFLSYGGKLY